MANDPRRVRSDLMLLQSQIDNIGETLSQTHTKIAATLRELKDRENDVEVQVGVFEGLIRTGNVEAGKLKEHFDQQRLQREELMMKEMKKHTEKVRFEQRQAQNLWRGRQQHYHSLNQPNRAYPRYNQSLLACVGSVILVDAQGRVLVAIGQSGLAGVWISNKDDREYRLAEIIPASIHEVVCGALLDAGQTTTKDGPSPYRRRFLLCTKQGAALVFQVSVSTRGQVHEVHYEVQNMKRLFLEDIQESCFCAQTNQIATLSVSGQIRCWSTKDLSFLWETDKGVASREQGHSICHIAWDIGSKELYAMTETGRIFTCGPDLQTSGVDGVERSKSHETENPSTHSSQQPETHATNPPDAKMLLSNAAQEFFRKAELLSNNFLPPMESELYRRNKVPVLWTLVHEIKDDGTTMVEKTSPISKLYAQTSDGSKVEGNLKSLTGKDIMRADALLDGGDKPKPKETLTATVIRPTCIALVRATGPLLGFVGCQDGRLLSCQMRPFSLDAVLHAHLQQISTDQDVSQISQVMYVAAHKMLLAVHNHGLVQVWSIDAQLLLCLLQLPCTNPKILAVEGNTIFVAADDTIFLYDMQPTYSWLDAHKRDL